jgi:hypothetical protein
MGVDGGEIFARGKLEITAKNEIGRGCFVRWTLSLDLLDLDDQNDDERYMVSKMMNHKAGVA